MKIKISDMKAMREKIGATHLVLFAVDGDGKQHVATHGKTKINAVEAAKAGNNLKSVLGWPENLCNEKPLSRVCKNCIHYKKARYLCLNGWSDDGKTCRYFEPNA